MSYTIHSNFIDTGYYSIYYFDENANITNILNKEVDYKFWGMLPEDKQIALYYEEENNGTYSLYDRALRYEKGIKSKSFWNDDNLMKNMLLAVFNSTIQIRADTSKLNPPQTNTKEANEWKKEVTNKTISWYVFDSYGNITNSDTEYFWGATNDGTKLYGLYYIYDRNWSTYNSKSYYIRDIGSSKYLFPDNSIKEENIIFPVKTNYTYDYSKTNTSTTTAENNEWKSKVAGKTIEEKDVMNTYTFLSNGDISVQTANGKIYNLHFWGAKNSTNGIYYVKINLRDIFGKVAPNEETYFYYGYEFDEGDYLPNNPTLQEYQQGPSYHKLFNNWHSNNFDKNGNPKNNVDWDSMPLQTTNIYWTTSAGLQDDIYLREK